MTDHAEPERERDSAGRAGRDGDPASDESGSVTGESGSASDEGESAPDDGSPRLDEGSLGSDEVGHRDEADDGDGVNDGDGADADDAADQSGADDDGDAADRGDDGPMPGVPDSGATDPRAAAADVPEDVRKYARFTKMDGAQYERVNEFLRDRTYITAREWALARLCADFRTETGVEMTKIGENLPELVPFMTDTYTPQAVNQARAAFEEKVRKAGATFLYGAMCDFFTAEQLDDVMYESTEVAKFLLEVEGVDLAVEEELDAEERISSVMREVRRSSDELRRDETECPNCGHIVEGNADD